MGQNFPTTFPSTSYWEVTEANRKCALQAKKKQRLGLALWLTLSRGPRDSSVVIAKNVGEHRFPEKL